MPLVKKALLSTLRYLLSYLSLHFFIAFTSFCAIGIHVCLLAQQIMFFCRWHGLPMRRSKRRFWRHS
jgi:hypothetical protein